MSRSYRTPVVAVVFAAVVMGSAGSAAARPIAAETLSPPAVAAALPGCTIVGTTAADVIVGTAGDDVICALGGADSVLGGGGDDVLFGSEGDDRMDGGPGDDRLYGWNGADRLRGGPGDDWFQGSRGPDLISGGPGTDTADYSSRRRDLRITLAGGADDGWEGEGDAIDVENVSTGRGNDVVVGNGAANVIHGGRGADRLRGGRGDDQLWGDQGGDRLDGRDSDGFSDWLRCGGGGGDMAMGDAADHVQGCEGARMRRPSAPVNHTPNGISLSPSDVAENQPVGTMVGTLEAADRDRGQHHAFRLVDGAGGADNSMFRIDGSALRTAATFDYEARHSYSIRVRARDDGKPAKSLTRALSVSVTNVNEAPAGLTLSSRTVAENEPVGTTVGTFSTTDQDAGDAHTFALVAGAGDGGNGSFQIAGSALKTKAMFDFETAHPMSVRVRVDDGHGGTFDLALAITVSDVNEAPTDLTLSNATLPENKPAGEPVGDLAAADPDTGQHHAFALASGVADNAAFVIDGSTLKTAQALDFEGQSSYTVKVRATDDGTPALNIEREFTVTVTNMLEPPTVSGVAAATDEDTTKTVQLTATDPEGDDPLSFAVVPGSANGGTPASIGAVVCNHATPNVCTADVDFVPAPNFHGAAGFAYVANDGTADSATPATVSIAVSAVNDAPDASHGTATTDEDTPKTITLAASDVDGDALTFDTSSNPALGAVGPVTCTGATPNVCTADVVYTPAPDGNGSDSFTFTVNDGALDSAAATVDVTIDPVNDAPQAPNANRTTDEDTPVALDLAALAGDKETSDANLTYEIVTPPAHGTADATTYTPAANFNGTDTVEYKVTDRGDPDNCSSAPCAAPKSAIGTVTITVDPVNDAPQAPNGSRTTDEDTPVALDLAALAGDEETSDADLTYEIVTPPAHGTADPTTYTPAANFNGTDTVEYKVTDRGDPDNCSSAPCAATKSATGTVTITVDPVNDAPQASNGSRTTDEDTPVALDLAALVDDVETDNANLTYEIVTPPAHGTANATTYTPAGNFNGTDTVEYEVTDRGDPDNCSAAPCAATKSATGTVTITVDAVNDAPANTVPAGTVSVAQGADKPITGLSVADVDADGDDIQVTLAVTNGTLTVSTSVIGGVGTLQVAGNGTTTVVVTASRVAIDTTLGDANGVVYHAPAAFSGSDPLTITTDDQGHNGAGGAKSDTDTLAIMVNSPPVAAAQSATTDEDTAKTITLSASDADGQAMTLAKGTGPSHGTLGAIGSVTCTGATPNVCTANVTYTPATDYNGPDEFTFTASDGFVTSSAATVSITVTAVNDGPHPDNIEFTTLSYTENDPATPITASTTVTDIDSPNFDTGMLQVDFAAGGTADDRLEIENQGSGPGQIGASGSTVSYEGTAIGTFTGGTGTTDLVVSFNANATPAATQALIRAITYRNVSDNPSTADRTVRFLVDDGDGAQVVTGRLIALTAVNDIPVVNLDAAGALAYTENAGFQNVAGANATVADVDSATLDSLIVTITSGFDAAFDTLELNTAGFSANFAGGALTITKAGGTPADFTTALRNVRFRNTDDDPDNRDDGTPNPGALDRTAQAVADDGPATSAAVTRNITITPVNDAPGAPTPAPSVAGVRNTTLVAGTNAVTDPKATRSADLKGNSIDPDGLESAITVVPAAAAATSQAGRITLDSAGNLVYEPPASVTVASDTYGYQLTDGTTASASITFTVNLSGEVWYVADGAPTPRDGTSARPFDTLAGALGVATTNDAIHVRRAPGDGTLTGGVTLQAGQKLLGEGVALTGADVGASGSPGTLFAAGTRPVLTATNADVVSLAAGNEIRGLDIDPQGTGGGISGGAGDAGGTIADVAISDAGTTGTQPGLELNGTSGTFNVSNFAVANSATGVLLNNAGTADFGATTIASAGARGLDATGTNMGTSTFDAITAAGVLMSNTGGTTVFGDGIGVDLNLTTSSGAAFDLNNAGSVTVGSAGSDNVTATNGPAIDVRGTAAANLAFDDVNSTNSTGDGIDLAGLGTGTFSASGGTIAGASGISFDLDGGSGAISYDGALNNGSGVTAVDITGRSGGTVTLSGSIADTNDAGGGISLSANTGGSTTLDNNTSKVFNTTTSDAVSFSGSDGHTLNLTGGNLDVDATSGQGVVAANSGTINVTGSGNTVTTTTGRAVNVQNTEFGGSGFTFQSVSSNGAPNGILLNNTGTTAGMTITGTGANNSGGSIQNATQHGVSLTTTNNFSAAELSITGANFAGVDGTDVTNFTFTNGEILNAGDSLTDPLHASIAFNDQAAGTENNIDGTLVITGNLLKDAYGGGVDVFNRAGTITDATVSNNTLDSPADEALSKEDAISFNLFGNASTVASLTKAQIEDNVITDFPSGNGIAFLGAQTNVSPAPTGSVGIPGSATNRILIDGNLLTGDPVNRFGGAAILAGVEGRGQGNFDITNNGTVANPITNVGTHAIATGNSGSSTVDYLIEGNRINANNFEAGGGGIRSASDQHIMVGGSTLATPTLNTIINNNVVRNTTGIGIRVLAANSNGTANVRVTNNDVANGGAGTPPIDIGNGSSADAAFSHTMCATISGNTTAANAPSGGGNTFPGILLSKRFTTANQYPFGLTGLSPSPSTNANTEAYVTGLNPNASLGGGFYAGKRVAVNVGDNFTSCTHPPGF